MPRKFDFISPGVQLTEIDQSQVEAPLQDDGLLIIGRANAGPALKPVKVKNLENFIDIFGKPVSGKGTKNNDVWRDGNQQGPTYGMYAAQAWLASETSPVTYVRLLGEDFPGTKPSGYTYAGWENGGANLSTTPDQTGTAYGMWIFPSSSINLSGSSGGANALEGNGLLSGTLAAIIYTTGSGVALNGTIIGSGSATTSSVGLLVQSISTAAKANTFRLDFYSGSSPIDANGATNAYASKTFHFDSTDKSGYIRNVLNTNPQLVSAGQFASGESKTYWLGESYEEAVQRIVTDKSGSAGQQMAILLPLQSGSTTSNNLMYHRAEATAAKTGWFINRAKSPTENLSAFVAGDREKLFRLVSLHEGEWFQKNYYVTIEDITLGSVKNPNSSFSVVIKRVSNDEVVEKFSNLNLDESSNMFISKRIGDQYQTWSDTNKRYELYGEYENMSNYVRVDLSTEFDGVDDAYKVPFGFLGPVIPERFVALTGSGASYVVPTDNPTAASVQIAPYVQVGATTGLATIPAAPGEVKGGEVRKTPFMLPSGSDATGNPLSLLTASFEWPRLKLSEQNTNTGGTNYNPTDMFGLRHKLASKKTDRIIDDRSYFDLIRMPGASIDQFTPIELRTKHSFVFTLDDVRESSFGSNKFYWASGSHAAGSAYTSMSGTQDLLTAKVKQFAAPFFGGFDGLDVTQIDPFSNQNVLNSKTSENHYANYSIKKAIESVSDSEVVQYDVVSIPGLTNEALSNELITTVQNRGDALAIIDLEDGYKEKWENSGVSSGGDLGDSTDVLVTARSRDIDSSYAAAYWPRVRLRDTLSGNGDIFLAPSSIAGVGALAFSDANSDGPWFAPAGFNRGGISILGGSQGPRVIGTHKNLSKADRDDLYELNINPIARFPAIGEIVIFGQKTLQQTASALDRINVRRLMIYLKRRIGKVADTMLFEGNLEATWSRFRSRASLILEDVQARFGIQEFKLILDQTTTTPDLIDQNIMYAKIFVKPTRSIEFIAIDFIITKTGVQF